MKHFPTKGNEPSPLILGLVAIVPLLGMGAWLLFG